METLQAIAFTATSSQNVIFFDNFLQSTLSSDWTIISRHGEYAQNETECNISQQVKLRHRTSDHDGGGVVDVR